MKMYLIDPEAGTCKHIDEPSDLVTLQDLLGCKMVKQNRSAFIGYNDVIYTCDETTQDHGFITPAGRQFFGKGIVLAVPDGKPCPPLIPLTELRAQVFFPGRQVDMEPIE